MLIIFVNFLIPNLSLVIKFGIDLVILGCLMFKDIVHVKIIVIMIVALS